jgi:hypothetical protein
VSPYVSREGETSWIKIRNANYTQIAGRDELLIEMASADRKRRVTAGVVACWRASSRSYVARRRGALSKRERGGTTDLLLNL